MVVDPRRLRAAADARSAVRAPVLFNGDVRDGTIGGVPIRSYTPRTARRGHGELVFFHGGYGLFGTLDLQDGPCRRMAHALARTVVAVDYALAPERSLADAVDDAIAVIRSVRETGSGHVVCWGDSAGGALALAVAQAAPRDVDGLLLTNPNVDLSLSLFDTNARDGPDPEISRYAFRAWSRVQHTDDAPRFHEHVDGLPPSFVAVGGDDSLVPECRALVDNCLQAGITAHLMVLPGIGHGLVSAPDALHDVAQAMAGFLAELRIDAL